MPDSENKIDQIQIIPTTRPARAVFEWFSQAFSLFSQFKLQWISLIVTLYAVILLLTLIPLVGELLTSLLLPGLFIIAAQIEQHKSFDAKLIFNGIKFHLQPLLHLFAINFVAALIASSVAAVIVGDGAFSAESPQTMLYTIAVMLVVYIPFMMGLAFAPALIIFDKLNAVNAFKMSFLGCFKNAISLTVFSLILLFGLFLAALPMGLGLLIFLPIMHCVLFVMYKDIFRHRTQFVVPNYDDNDGNDDGSFLV